MTAQLVLDVFASARTRPARGAVDSHQRGWVTLPHQIAAHPLPGRPRPDIGDVLPAYLCCRCGGVELNEHRIDRSHGCCDPNTINHPCDRRVEGRWPGWALTLDACWTPEHPSCGAS